MSGRPPGAGEASLLAAQLRAVNERLVISSVREHELADEAERRRAQLSALLEALAEGVVIAAPGGDVVMVNRAARGILGAGAESGAVLFTAEGRGGADLRGLDDATLADDARPLRRALRGEQFEGAEVVLHRADGDTRRVMTSGTSIREGADLALAIVVLRDVTDVRRLEEQREEYLALISHDLRGPVTAITLVARSLREAAEEEDDHDPRIADRIDRIEKNATRMEAMIAELLEATSLERGAGGRQRIPCPLGDVVRDVVAPMDERRRSRVTLHELHEGVPCVLLADAASLARAIGNLVANALAYSTGEVEVRWCRRGDCAAVDVVDHGPGIAPGDVPLLFHRYYRASAGQRVGGLGLGLYIVRLIAEAHGGDVTVATELGQGSTFSLVLPLLAHADAHAPSD